METLEVTSECQSDGWSLTDRGPVIHVRCRESFDYQTKSITFTLGKIDGYWGLVVTDGDHIIGQISPHQTELIADFATDYGAIHIEWIFRSEVAPNCDCEDVHIVEETVKVEGMKKISELGGEPVTL
jgi:hypothetical protein